MIFLISKDDTQKLNDICNKIKADILYIIDGRDLDDFARFKYLSDDPKKIFFIKIHKAKFFFEKSTDI